VEIPGCRFADRCALVEDACRKAPVPLADVGPGRSVRCVRWPEIAGRGVPAGAASERGEAR